MRQYFEGWYFRHQTGPHTIALIPGRSGEGAFIQVITEKSSHHVPFPLSAFQKGHSGAFPLSGYKKGGIVAVGKNTFSERGVHIDICENDFRLSGKVEYGPLTPLKSDIMGPFRFLPMECRHRVLSMGHRLEGALVLNNSIIDFTGGAGYIEGDSGRSFPKNYLWAQCNDLGGESSVMVSVAKIPVPGGWFWGCVSAVLHKGEEFRLATYNGVKICSFTKTGVELRQGRLHLRVEVEEGPGHPLYAPRGGRMDRVIREGAAVRARFYFASEGRVLFDRTSGNAGFEFA